MAGHARRSVGRPAGGESTRSEVLSVARTVFAEQGYAGTSLRGVAAAVGVDPSTVVHFFATKQGLFRAAVEDALPAVSKVVDGLITGAPGHEVVRSYVAAYDDPETGPALIAILRTSLGSVDASGVVDELLLQQVAVNAAPARRLGVELAMTELVGLAVTRYLARMPHVANLSADDVAALVGPRLDHLLGEPQSSAALPARR